MKHDTVFMIIAVLWLFLMSSSANAQPPTAAISSLQGEVFVSFQGGTPISGIDGSVLRAGDIIRTYTGGGAMLSLSDGSKLELGENTNMLLSALEKDPAKGRMELLWGRVRAILSPVYQAESSSFTVQTPNALVGTTSSELDVEVLYDPNIKTTTVLAHEFAIRVINLLTGIEFIIPQGHSGIIHDGIIQEIAQIITPPSLTTGQQEAAIMTSLSGDVLISLQGKAVTPGTEGVVLRASDTIRTNAGASVVLKFSDGTLMTIGENTNLNLYNIFHDQQTDLRTSRVELFRGTVRIVLANGYEMSGASFTVQTPNVEVMMANTPQADAEVQYEPNTNVTTTLAHKFDLFITHLLTEVSTAIPAGHSGIIYNHVIQEVARILASDVETAQTPTEAEEVSDEEEAPAEEQSGQ